MTRLQTSHIQETNAHLARIDDLLKARVQTDLRGVAFKTIEVTEAEAAKIPPKKVAVVPITAGEGIIPGFSQTIAAIARYIGFAAGVTRDHDVAGLAQAYADGSDIVVLADDKRFMAIDIHSGTFVDNDRATGESFAMLLEMMAGSANAGAYGVIGCGPVGTAAALRLAKRGARVSICDIDGKRRRRLITRIQAESANRTTGMAKVATLMTQCAFIIDATPVAGIIKAGDLRPETVITAPGVPTGLTPRALDQIGPRYYHDNLPLGVATMILAAGFGKMTTTTPKPVN